MQNSFRSSSFSHAPSCFQTPTVYHMTGHTYDQSNLSHSCLFLGIGCHTTLTLTQPFSSPTLSHTFSWELPVIQIWLYSDHSHPLPMWSDNLGRSHKQAILLKKQTWNFYGTPMDICHVCWILFLFELIGVPSGIAILTSLLLPLSGMFCVLDHRWVGENVQLVFEGISNEWICICNRAVPSAVFSQPPIGQVGLSEEQVMWIFHHLQQWILILLLNII